MANNNDIALVPFEKDHLNVALLWINNMSRDRLPVLSKEKLSTETAMALIEAPDSIFYIIHNAQKNTIGFVRISNMDCRKHCCTMYLYIDSKLDHLSSVELSAIETAVKYCFFRIGVNKIIVEIPYGNVYLMRLYERIGFKRDILRRQHYFVNGQYRHVVEMSLIRQEKLG